MAVKSKKKRNNQEVMALLKGCITAMIFTIAAILIFAIILKMTALSDKVIPYINQVIKIVGILMAAYVTVNSGKKIWLGAAGGAAYVLLTFFLFSLVNGGMGSVLILLSDLVMGAVIGGIAALILSKKWKKA